MDAEVPNGPQVPRDNADTISIEFNVDSQQLEPPRLPHLIISRPTTPNFNGQITNGRRSFRSMFVVYARSAVCWFNVSKNDSNLDLIHDNIEPSVFKGRVFFYICATKEINLFSSHLSSAWLHVCDWWHFDKVQAGPGWATRPVKVVWIGARAKHSRWRAGSEKSKMRFANDRPIFLTL